MRLDLQTDFALRTLMFLAVRSGRQTIPRVAEFYGISEPHVAKVVNQLARLGYLRGIRGVGGGIELARPPREISVGGVIRDFEKSMHLLDCVGTDDVCAVQSFCKLRGVLGEAERRQMAYLDSVTLHDVLPAPRDVERVAAGSRRRRGSA